MQQFGVIGLSVMGKNLALNVRNHGFSVSGFSIDKPEVDAFAKYDMILCPCAPTTAPAIGSSLSDPIKMYLSDIYTISLNLAGLPGISVPLGMDSKGLPVGGQLIGKAYGEQTLLDGALSLERALR